MAYTRNLSVTQNNSAVISGSQILVTGSIFAGQISGTTAQFTTLTASQATFTNNVLIYGTASLNINPTVAYIVYNSGSDKLVAFPGLLISGSLTGSGLIYAPTLSGSTLNALTISGSTAQFTSITGSHSGSGVGLFNITASGISNFTSDVRGQFTAGTNITINNGQISASGGGTPGGTNQTIQFNSGSTFSGSTNLIYNYTNNILSGTTAQFTTLTGSTLIARNNLSVGKTGSNATVDINGDTIVSGNLTVTTNANIDNLATITAILAGSPNDGETYGEITINSHESPTSGTSNGAIVLVPAPVAGEDLTINYYGNYRIGTDFSDANRFKVSYGNPTVYGFGSIIGGAVLGTNDILILSKEVSGSVGIGTSGSLTEKLTVSGNILATGTGIVSGSTARFTTITGSTITGSFGQFSYVTASAIFLNTNGFPTGSGLTASEKANIAASSSVYTTKAITAGEQSAGSATHPVYNFSAQPGTGMYFPANNTLAFAVNQSESLRIERSTYSRLGVNEVNPSGLIHTTFTTGSPDIAKIIVENNAAGNSNSSYDLWGVQGLKTRLINVAYNAAGFGEWTGGGVLHSSGSTALSRDSNLHYSATTHRWYKNAGSSSLDRVMTLDTSGNLAVSGTLTVTGSTIFTTISGTTAQFTIISGTNVLSTNLTGTTAQFTTITASNLTGSKALFTELTASKAVLSNNILIYGSASLSANPSAAYIVYDSLNDRLQAFPGLYVSGSTTISGNLTVTGIITTGSAAVPTPGGINQSIQFKSGSAFSGSTNLLFDYTNNVLSGTTAQFTTITGSTALITGLLTLSDGITGSNAQFTIVTSSFTGSGAGLYNLTASGINNFTNDVRAQFSAGSNITIVTGTISAINIPVYGQVTASFTRSVHSINIFISDASVTTSSYIAASVALPATRDIDEMEMAPVAVAAGSINTGVGFNIIAVSLDGDADGTYLINYTRL